MSLWWRHLRPAGRHRRCPLAYLALAVLLALAAAAVASGRAAAWCGGASSVRSPRWLRPRQSRPHRSLLWAASAVAAEPAAVDSGEESDEKDDEPPAARSGVRSGLSARLRDRLKTEIAAAEAQVDVVPTEDQTRIVMQEVDLNGIDYMTCILGSIPVAGLSYGFWAFTGATASYFVTHPIDSEFYPVQRLGIAFQTAVVGLSSLAAGIFGFTALGIFLLGIRVAVGISSGELDPQKQSDDETVRQSTAEKVRDILTKDPVDVVMAARRAKEKAAAAVAQK
mmetsp:Transcript_110623/g.298077  ORF Transcript_110623/g.298077 Transcript_110623/m.298077 type:complete len:281 (-) Transcript_110623:129-971(-)